MKIDRYLELCKIIEAEEKMVEEGKRESYTVGDENVLANFMRDAATAGIDPLQNWLTHFLKQVAAVVSYIRNPEVEPSEPLISRVVDLRVYPKLLLALAEDLGRVTGVEKCADKKFDTAPYAPSISDNELASVKKFEDKYNRQKQHDKWVEKTAPWNILVSPGWPLPDPPYCGSGVIDISTLSTGMHDYAFGKDW